MSLLRIVDTCRTHGITISIKASSQGMVYSLSWDPKPGEPEVLSLARRYANFEIEKAVYMGRDHHMHQEILDDIIKMIASRVEETPATMPTSATTSASPPTPSSSSTPPTQETSASAPPPSSTATPSSPSTSTNTTRTRPPRQRR